MSGKLDLRVKDATKVDVPVRATVDVTGAAPGALVTLELALKRGPAGRVEPPAQVTHADDQGRAAVVFTVTLSGPGTALLLATGFDRNGLGMDPDAEKVEVLS
jgi:hypothetical protein